MKQTGEQASGLESSLKMGFEIIPFAVQFQADFLLLPAVYVIHIRKQPRRHDESDQNVEIVRKQELIG